MSFSPVSASETIVRKYKRYLKTIFSLDSNVYNEQFQALLNEPQSFSSGPFLDVSDSFVKGKSIEELISHGFIAPSFSHIKMPLTRPLYKHQEVSIEKVIAGKNVVVSTGTGSGKTESFLIPVLNYIIRQQEQGVLDAGVRALLIYPMNALANDQIERLRELLSDYTQITYGSYTGQTKDKYKDALAEYKALNEGQTPLPNELISREQIKATPPHILITNYAMLEYLMVRPDDSVFFSEGHAHKWKFVVLDEAHVYNGSAGIEVAMLLRRLKAKLQNNDINYILTSATLGDEESNAEVASFARNLCNCDFDTSDIVRAFRTKPMATHESVKLPVSFYRELAEYFESRSDEKLIAEYLSRFSNEKSGPPIEELLYDIILHDENYSALKDLLSTARTLQDLANNMGWEADRLADFVTVASKAEKNRDRLLDARYHMFLRATESVFITLNPSNKLFLTRKRKHLDANGIDYHVFEIATCSVCHAIYIIGNIKNGYLEQSSFNNEDELRSVFLLKNEISDTDDDHLMEEEEIAAEEYEVCARCGFIQRAGKVHETACEHGRSYMVKVFKVQVRNERGTLTKCLSCENTNGNGILRMFFTGQEAVTSVIGTALFEELPSYKIITQTVADDDDSGFGFGGEVAIEQKVTEAKQFIAFSDNRQAAAFYASYLDQTYRNILYKRLIVETLAVQNASWMGKAVNYFVEDLISQFEKYGVIKSNADQCRKEAWKAILQEMVDNNGTTSLYSMGLIGFALDPGVMRENGKLGLSKDDVCMLCNVLALGMMSDAVIYYDYSMNRADKEFFAHNGVEYSYTLSSPDTKSLRRSFIPRFADKNNKRADYLRRILRKMGQEIEQEKANELLGAIWNNIFVREGYVRHLDGAYRLDSQKIIITKPKLWYICPKCRKITPYNLHGVCPSYQCDGELIPINLYDTLQDNHYYQMYQTLDIRELRVVEHTAQLSKETAYEYQKQFKRKEIDVLSCSTTFEMGVDVGTLETVFMRNMPPSPANYAQRAGRAGRSHHSAAYALTFCNKSNHDFSFFSAPLKMIRGRIDPPKFVVENEKIAIRHMYASALAFFWKAYPTYFSKTANMTEALDNAQSGVEVFKQYLHNNPHDLKEYLKRFLPMSLYQKFCVESFGWIESLLGTDEKNPGVLTKAVAEYEYEVNILRQAIAEAIRNEGRVDRLRERIKVYRNEEVLSFLSRKNVLPKYGFPVDTVEMSVVSRTEHSKLGLQLQRDLAIAISEYAPGSQIVANGNLITSRYIRKIPNMSWKMYDYIACDCKTLNIEPHTDDTNKSELRACCQCSNALDPQKRKVFLVPEFGFEADGDRIEKPTLRKPERTYHGDISYVGYRTQVQPQQFLIGNSSIEIAISRGDEMAVINESNFFVCESCGFTDLDENAYGKKTKKLRHKNSAGYWCQNDGTNTLRRFSLGYRFETDVLQLRFINPDVTEWEVALSILNGILRGICSCLNIEASDIAGCVQYFYNDITLRPNYSLILYDKTPGGAGHVRRLVDATVLKAVLVETLDIMENCSCGGDQKDSSCYACLRSYYNQKYHDILSRKHVIDFIKLLFR